MKLVNYIASLRPWATHYVIEWWNMTGSFANARAFRAVLEGADHVEQTGRRPKQER